MARIRVATISSRIHSSTRALNGSKTGAAAFAVTLGCLFFACSVGLAHVLALLQAKNKQQELEARSTIIEHHLVSTWSPRLLTREDSPLISITVPPRGTSMYPHSHTDSNTLPAPFARHPLLDTLGPTLRPSRLPTPGPVQPSPLAVTLTLHPGSPRHAHAPRPLTPAMR